MYSIRCNIVKSNPVNAAKDASIYVLKNRDTIFGIQKPVVRAGVDASCKKMALVTFTSRKDVLSFVRFCGTLQQKGIGLNTGLLQNDVLEFQAMEAGNRWMSLNAVEVPFAEVENMCMVHAIDLVLLRELSVEGRPAKRGLQGIEVTYDPPPPAMSVCVLNRVYNRA